MVQKIILYDKESVYPNNMDNFILGIKTAQHEWFQFNDNTFVYLENFKGSKSDIYSLLMSMTGHAPTPSFMELIDELKELRKRVAHHNETLHGKLETELLTSEIDLIIEKYI